MDVAVGRHCIYEVEERLTSGQGRDAEDREAWREVQIECPHTEGVEQCRDSLRRAGLTQAGAGEAP